jgi:hypothetical protein
MDKITHISVRPGDDAEPADPPKAVYVDAPDEDVLDEEPFASGRHRLERVPGTHETPATTLWSWTEGDR